MKLIITVTFASGRYHGKGKFPPSPARLFQAMIAGSHRGAYGLINTDVRDAALMWLERLAPPLIEASDYIESGGDVTNYVPNNDNDFTHNRTAKQMRSLVLTGEKTARYVWAFQETGQDTRNAQVVCAIASLVSCLGHGVDEVFIRGTVTEDSESAMHPAYKVYEPQVARGGEWEAPREGSYHAYKSRYQNVINEANRNCRPDARAYAVPTQQVEYNLSGHINLDAPLALFNMRRLDDSDKYKDFDARDLRQPSAMVRHAVKEWTERAPQFVKHYGEELVSRLAFGHEPRHDDETSKNVSHYNGAHISYVPLPSLTRNSIADGRIRRVLLIGNGCEQEAAQQFFFDMAANLDGAKLKDNEKPIGILQRVETLSDDTVLRMYQARKNGGCSLWRSVTPIVLTGMTRRGRALEQLVLRALKQIGFEETDVDSIAAYRSPIVPKTARPLDYNLNGHLTNTPRFHAEIRFKRPVSGVLVLGRGRNVGFGLMLPITRND